MLTQSYLRLLKKKKAQIVAYVVQYLLSMIALAHTPAFISTVQYLLLVAN